MPRNSASVSSLPPAQREKDGKGEGKRASYTREEELELDFGMISAGFPRFRFRAPNGRFGRRGRERAAIETRCVSESDPESGPDDDDASDGLVVT